jgi:hypothetical protein
LDPTVPYVYIDNLGFAAPLPEPASLALLGAGGLLAFRRRRQA